MLRANDGQKSIKTILHELGYRLVWHRLSIDVVLQEFQFGFWDHPFITSEKELGEGGSKKDIFADGQYCIHADIVGGSEKVQKCADVIYGWSILGASLRSYRARYSRRSSFCAVWHDCKLWQTLQ